MLALVFLVDDLLLVLFMRFGASIPLLIIDLERIISKTIHYVCVSSRMLNRLHSFADLLCDVKYI